MDKPQLTDMDIYCMTRMIQNSFQAPEEKDITNTSRPFYGCMYCKYAFVCRSYGSTKPNFKIVFEKLKNLTGIPVGTYFPGNDPEGIGSVFFPNSYYVEHPEMLNELERIHPKSMMDGFKASLDKVIACSKENPD
ncbi:hypothetical protein E5329_23185 [Petralouisia muris]|uniref:Uncharacterized protein n=1 Tax=Petralouisia muris TaxID=3032872 RepID=A0AC61RQ97_9FIRM|nr:hypothetical protein [Petralouisia muris]TGY90998.1 hypothetical protein E5329_23185 [Petralouisia muris]